MQHKMKRLLLVLVLSFMLAISASGASAEVECVTFNGQTWCMQG